MSLGLLYHEKLFRMDFTFITFVFYFFETDIQHSFITGFTTSRLEFLLDYEVLCSKFSVPFSGNVSMSNKCSA